MQQKLGQITWLDGQLTGAPPCPACGGTEPKTLVLETANLIQERQSIPLRLVACETCRTRYWTDLGIFHYEGSDGYSWSTRFYVEQGASIDGLIEPIAWLPAASIKSCLEIGCGFGFSLDMGRVLFGWRTVGVDPSPLARAGRIALEIDIRPIYADSESELGGPFDMVYGSEVIEHVAVPQEFLKICRAHLAPGGMMVLTTPDGDSIRPDVPTAALMPILSPGHHLVLYNGNSLQNIARAAGFAFTQVVLREHSLVLYASDRPFVVDAAPIIVRGPYRAYLAGMLERPGPASELRTGLRYRLFKELVNAREYHAGLTLFGEIIDDCQARFGMELSPEKALDGIAAIRRGRFNAPFCLPGLLFFRGMIALNGSPAPAQSAAWFDAAAATAAAFRTAYQAVGIDDGETGEIERRGPELAVLALCHSDPALAIERARLLPSPGDEFIKTLALRLLDLGHLEQAAEAAALTENAALTAMVAGWGHLLNNRHAEAHDALQKAMAGGGPIGLRAQSADVLVLTSLDPGAAVKLGRELSAQSVPLDDLFMRLVDLGHLTQAAAIESAVDGSEAWRLLGRRGILALIYSKHPTFAAELFQRAFDTAGDQGSADELWRLKYHQLLALITAAKAGAARQVAKEIASADGDVPQDITGMVEALLKKHPAARPG